MQDPVILADSGHSYERAAILAWLETHNTDPVTKEKLTHKHLIPNLTLRNLIAEISKLDSSSFKKPPIRSWVEQELRIHTHKLQLQRRQALIFGVKDIKVINSDTTLSKDFDSKQFLRGQEAGARAHWFASPPCVSPVSDFLDDTKERNNGHEFFQHGTRLYQLFRFSEALPWFLRAARHDYPPAFLWLLHIYQTPGFGVLKDSRKALLYHKLVSHSIPWFMLHSQRGDALAQYCMGECFLINIASVNHHIAKAIYWLKKSADQGYAEASFLLASIYETGFFLAKDITETIKFYRQAIEQGHLHAQYRLSCLYREEMEVVQDKREAARLCCELAQQGSVLALHTKASIALEDCVAQNTSKGLQGFFDCIQQFTLAAIGGYVESQRVIAMHWYLHKAVLPSALYWFLRAAEQGNEASQEYVQTILEKEPKLAAFVEQFAMLSSDNLSPSVSSFDKQMVGLKESEDSTNEDRLPSMLCPISKEPMQSPMTSDMGFSYENSAIEKWFLTLKQKDPVEPCTDPMTNVEVSSQLIANHNLRQAIIHLELHYLLPTAIESQERLISNLKKALQFHGKQLQEIMPRIMRQDKDRDQKSKIASPPSSTRAPTFSSPSPVLSSLVLPGGSGRFAPPAHSSESKTKLTAAPKPIIFLP